MREQEGRGQLSKAHAYDHVTNVSGYAGFFVPYFARKLGVQKPERLAPYARMAGLSHDIIRYASQTDSGEEASAIFLQGIYDAHFSGSVEREDYERFVVDIVRNSDSNLSEMRETYKNDAEALAVALAVVSGDKLIEASGPRVLERRSFFVGKERMQNPKDLGAVFNYPKESHEGVLTETMVRLGHVNHISNYFPEPSLLDLAQHLHSYQYQWYRGLLLNLGLAEAEALDYFVRKLRNSPITQKLADRVEEGGKRLVEEEHMNGKYFRENSLSALLESVRSMPEDDELEESSWAIVSHFAETESPEVAIKSFEENPYGPPTFRSWMEDIISYRKGEFAKHLLAKL